MKHFSALFLCLLLRLLPVCAQHEGEIWNYEHLSKNDGLSSNRITALSDDRYGRIWVGTSQGLDIYDSRSLKKIEPYAGLEICSLHDAGDRILVGTTLFRRSLRLCERPFFAPDVERPRCGICPYDSASRQYGAGLKTLNRIFRCDGDRLTLVADGTPYEYMCCDKFGQLWGLSKDRVYRIDRSFGVAATYKLSSVDRSPLVGVQLYADSKGCVWVGTDQGRPLPLQPDEG